MHTTDAEQNNAPTLLAIAIAARRAGDRDLERYAKGRLREQHGVKMTFEAGKQERQGKVTR